jgi:hypothetical protein
MGGCCASQANDANKAATPELLSTFQFGPEHCERSRPFHGDDAASELRVRRLCASG